MFIRRITVDTAWWHLGHFLPFSYTGRLEVLGAGAQATDPVSTISECALRPGSLSAAEGRQEAEKAPQRAKIGP